MIIKLLFLLVLSASVRPANDAHPPVLKRTFDHMKHIEYQKVPTSWIKIDKKTT